MLEIPQLNGNIIYQRNNINIYGGEPSRAVDTEWTFLGILGGSDKDRQEMIKTANVNRSFSPTHPFIYFIVDNRSGAIMFMGRFAGNEK